MKVIGIDIGGTSIKGALIDDTGKVFNTFSMPVDKDATQEKTVNDLICVVKKYIDENQLSSVVEGIGIGIPGSLDMDKGIVIYANNLRWNNLPIVDMFKKELPYEVKVINDAKAATLAESMFGVGKKYDHLVMLTLGTGVGGGVIINKRLYLGHNNEGQELGHTIIELNGRDCTCGRKGCLEAYASATALIADTKKAMEKNPDSLMHEIAKELGKVDGRVSFFAAQKGDQAAIDVVNQYVSFLGEGILNCCNSFRPDAVILSGGIANQGEYLTSRLDKFLADRHYGYQGTSPIPVLIAEVGYDSGKIGAACLFFQK